MKIECGDNPEEMRAHVGTRGATIVDFWDHIVEHHPGWMRELFGYSDAKIRRELTRWLRLA